VRLNFQQPKNKEERMHPTFSLETGTEEGGEEGKKESKK